MKNVSKVIYRWSCNRCQMPLPKINLSLKVVIAKKCQALKLIQNFIFDYHVQDLCKEANRKLRALAPAIP